MPLAVTLTQAILVVVLLIAAPSLIRLFLWLDNLFKWTTVATWGVLLEGQADEADRLLGEIQEHLEQSGHDVTRKSERDTWESREYATVKGQSTLVYYAGTHPIERDLYVTWTARTQNFGRDDPTKWGLNQTNYVRGFANSTLAAVQNAVNTFAQDVLGLGPLSAEQMEASGVLGPLPHPPSIEEEFEDEGDELDEPVKYSPLNYGGMSESSYRAVADLAFAKKSEGVKFEQAYPSLASVAKTYSSAFRMSPRERQIAILRRIYDEQAPRRQRRRRAPQEEEQAAPASDPPPSPLGDDYEPEQYEGMSVEDADAIRWIAWEHKSSRAEYREVSGDMDDEACENAPTFAALAKRTRLRLLRRVFDDEV